MAKPARIDREETQRKIDTQKGHNTDGTATRENPDTSLCGHGRNSLTEEENLNRKPTKEGDERLAEGKHSL